MILKLTIESGVNISDTYGELDLSNPQEALKIVGEKAKELLVQLHPELLVKK